MFMRFVVPFVAAAMLMFSVLADEAGAVRSFALARQGQLTLAMPIDWTTQQRTASPDLPPTITLRPASGDAFEVLLTPIGAQPNATAPDQARLRSLALQALERARPQALEAHIPLLEMTGAMGSGYYFSATDKAPLAGEYRHQTQGLLRVGALTLVFTVLTRDSDRATVAQVMHMLKGATHRASPVTDRPDSGHPG